MKTFNMSKEDAEREWYLIDAADQRVGRIATQIAMLLRGKNKPTFTPNQDNGSFVVVINTEKLQLTGVKWESKKFYRHSRFFGSMKEKTAAQKKAEDPAFILEEAVRGMLPTNKLSRHLMLKLKAYAGSAHPHAAQKPTAYKLPKN